MAVLLAALVGWRVFGGSSLASSYVCGQGGESITINFTDQDPNDVSGTLTDASGNVVATFSGGSLRGEFVNFGVEKEASNDEQGDEGDGFWGMLGSGEGFEGSDAPIDNVDLNYGADLVANGLAMADGSGVVCTPS